MPRETIPNAVIKNMFGNDWRVPQRDDDGTVIWESSCELCDKPEAGTQPKLVKATASMLIREILLNMTQLGKIQKPFDGRNATKLWNQIEKSKDGEDLQLHTAQYAWLHSLLTRDLPGEKGDDAKQTVAGALYGLNEWWVIQQLKTLHERSAIEEEEHEDPEDKDG